MDQVIVPVECTDEIAEAICSVVNVCGGIAESIWSKAVVAGALTPPHSDRVTELLAANNREVEKRRGATALLREALEDCVIEGSLYTRIETFLSEIHQ